MFHEFKADVLKFYCPIPINAATKKITRIKTEQPHVKRTNKIRYFGNNSLKVLFLTLFNTRNSSSEAFTTLKDLHINSKMSHKNQKV